METNPPKLFFLPHLIKFSTYILASMEEQKRKKPTKMCMARVYI